jgi:hypothetical protein
MQSTLIALTVFILSLAAISLYYRKSTLKNLKLLPGEDFFFEEYGIPVEQHAGVRIVYFGNCVIKISRERIVIAQKMPLFKNSYYIRFSITLGNEIVEMDLKATLKNGYVSAETMREKISETREGMLTIIIVPVSETKHIKISVKNGSDCMRALRGI